MFQDTQVDETWFQAENDAKVGQTQVRIEEMEAGVRHGSIVFAMVYSTIQCGRSGKS